MTGFFKRLQPFVLIAAGVVGGAIACTVPAQPGNPGGDYAAVLDEIPDEALNRFVLMVEAEKDGSPNPRNVAAVVSALREAGAEKVEPLEGTAIVFVTCRKAAIYAAIETGFVASLQVDRLSKPYR